MVKASGWKLATMMTPPRRAGEPPVSPPTAPLRSVMFRSNSRHMETCSCRVYRPVSAMVSRIGIFRALHKAVRFVSRGRTRPLSQ